MKYKNLEETLYLNILNELHYKIKNMQEDSLSWSVRMPILKGVRDSVIISTWDVRAHLISYDEV